jgi:hypothetical protein
MAEQVSKDAPQPVAQEQYRDLRTRLRAPDARYRGIVVMISNAREAILARVLALREPLQGEAVPPLDESRVHPDFREMARDAHALGASDEALHRPIAALLTQEYVDNIVERLDRNRDELNRWLSERPPTYETVAFINMEMVLDAFWDEFEARKKRS